MQNIRSFAIKLVRTFADEIQNTDVLAKMLHGAFHRLHTLEQCEEAINHAMQVSSVAFAMIDQGKTFVLDGVVYRKVQAQYNPGRNHIVANGASDIYSNAIRVKDHQGCSFTSGVLVIPFDR